MQKMYCRIISHLVIIFCIIGITGCTAASFRKTAEPKTANPEESVEKISTTKHSIQTSGGTLNYTAIAGYMPLSVNSGPKAEIFFTAYFKEPLEGLPRRPVTFAFNGGPGSSSVWLHIGGIGPKRIDLQAKSIWSSYQLIDNEYTWLDLTDLVFIDTVGTGYSFAENKNQAKDFYDVEKDISSTAEFIRLFLTKYHKWNAPKYIVGESYGTMRAVGLLNYLPKESGIKIDGAVLISSALNFETFAYKLGNDLPYALALPSYTAAAWFHKKLDTRLQEDFNKTQKEVMQWALSDYLTALAKGDTISDNDKNVVGGKLSEYTGLSSESIIKKNLRVNVWDFSIDLMKDKFAQTGIMDSRFTGSKIPPSAEDNDPYFRKIKPIFTSAFNHYAQTDLNFKSNRPYESLSMKVNSLWKWDASWGGCINYTDVLSNSIKKDPHLKIFAAMGYYDLTTPFCSQKYVYDHLELDDTQKKQITYGYFYSGHQVYSSEDSLKKLKNDVSDFYLKEQKK